MFKKEKEILSKNKTENLYVAFLDILGFSNSVKNDFDSTIETFNRFVESLYIFHKVSPKDVSLQIYSDSFLLKSKKLNTLVTAVQVLLWNTLMENFLVRGGIAYGEHIDAKSGNDFYILSKPLVNAVEVEKTIKYPCVSFHESVEIPNELFHPHINNFDRPILHYEGINLVNPFNIVWGTSAQYRVKMMLDENPQYAEKYKWFINLFDKVIKQEQLYP